MNILTALLIVLSIAHTVFDALSDAIIDETGKRKHWMQSSMIVFIGLAYYLQWWMQTFDPLFIVYFIMIRFSLFDTIYNSRRGLDLNYIGITGIWPKLIGWVPGWILSWIKGIVFFSVFYLGHLSEIYFIR